nr:Hypothetical protein FSTVLC9_393 [Faustovirus]
MSYLLLIYNLLYHGMEPLLPAELFVEIAGMHWQAYKRLFIACRQLNKVLSWAKYKARFTATIYGDIRRLKNIIRFDYYKLMIVGGTQVDTYIDGFQVKWMAISKYDDGENARTNINVITRLCRDHTIPGWAYKEYVIVGLGDIPYVVRSRGRINCEHTMCEHKWFYTPDRTWTINYPGFFVYYLE